MDKHTIDFNAEMTSEDYAHLNFLFVENQLKEKELFKLKNERYQASFFKQCDEDKSLSSAVVRLKDKVNRFSMLVKNPDIDTLDESIKDTLTDLANYSNMCLVYLDTLK